MTLWASAGMAQMEDMIALTRHIYKSGYMHWYTTRYFYQVIIVGNKTSISRGNLPQSSKWCGNKNWGWGRHYPQETSKQGMMKTLKGSVRPTLKSKASWDCLCPSRICTPAAAAPNFAKCLWWGTGTRSASVAEEQPAVSLVYVFYFKRGPSNINEQNLVNCTADEAFNCSEVFHPWCLPPPMLAHQNPGLLQKLNICPLNNQPQQKHLHLWSVVH